MPHDLGSVLYKEANINHFVVETDRLMMLPDQYRKFQITTIQVNLCCLLHRIWHQIHRDEWFLVMQPLNTSQMLCSCKDYVVQIKDC